MCGICGIINFDGQRVEPNRIKTMMERMKHRGPDDEGVFTDQNYGLGFVRLSVIDLTENGHQPMMDSSGRFVILHNGEIYNYKSLKEELKSKGYRFRSNTDSEVILYSYIEWGKECPEKFNGMWAFVIYDKKKKDIFISRDRYGIKPLYYFLNKDKFIFASEIPPILSIMKGKPSPDRLVIYDYLTFSRTDQNENTFFSGIKKLEPGCNIEIQNNHIKINKWYELSDHLGKPFENPDEFRDIFRSAVALRLQSDVPVGVCLSGGLDSSSITSVLIKDFQKNDLNTFSAIYGKGDRGDESEFMLEYEKTLKNMHFTFPTADTLFADMSNFMQAHAEPTPSAASYAQYKVMESAKNSIVVTLDGQGADEQLAGYHYYFGYYFKGMLRNIQWFKLVMEIYYYIKIHKSTYALKLFIYYILPTVIRNNFQNKFLMKRDFVKVYAKKSTLGRELSDPKDLKQSLITHFEKKLAILLKWEDRNSMYHSLESRVPFLDYRLVEGTLSMPDSDLLNKGMTKVILRQAMKGILPEKIRNRQDKMGFDTPQDEWFRQPVFIKYINEMLNSGEFRDLNIIDHNKAIDIFRKHSDGKQNYAKEIWKWINLDLWFKEFIY